VVKYLVFKGVCVIRYSVWYRLIDKVEQFKLESSISKEELVSFLEDLVTAIEPQSTE
jgi:hypothetical protein